MRHNPAFPMMTDLEMVGIDPEESGRLHQMLMEAAQSGSDTQVERALAAVKLAMGAGTLSEITGNGEVVAVFVDPGDSDEPTVIFDVEAGDFVFSTEGEWVEEWRGGGQRTKTRHARGSVYPSATANPLRRRSGHQSGYYGVLIKYGAIKNQDSQGGGWLPVVFVNNARHGTTRSSSGYDKNVAVSKASEMADQLLGRFQDLPSEDVRLEKISSQAALELARAGGLYSSLIQFRSMAEAERFRGELGERVRHAGKQGPGGRYDISLVEVGAPDLKTLEEVSRLAKRLGAVGVRDNPANLTHKGERMYGDIKRGYELKGDERAKEIAARTVYARAREGTPGLVQNPKRSSLTRAEKLELVIQAIKRYQVERDRPRFGVNVVLEAMLEQAGYPPVLTFRESAVQTVRKVYKLWD